MTRLVLGRGGASIQPTLASPALGEYYLEYISNSLLLPVPLDNICRNLRSLVDVEHRDVLAV